MTQYEKSKFFQAVETYDVDKLHYILTHWDSLQNQFVHDDFEKNENFHILVKWLEMILPGCYRAQNVRFFVCLPSKLLIM